jgi:integrase
MGKRANGEGNLRQRSDGRWEVRIVIDGRRRSFFGRTQAEARGKRDQAVAAAAKGLPIPDPRLTVRVFLGQWLEYQQSRVRPTTWRSYESKIRLHINPALGHLKLAKLSPQHVEGFLAASRSNGCSPRSVHSFRTVLRNALRAAERWGLIGRNVAALAAPVSVPARRRRALTANEARALLSALEGCKYEPLYSVSLSLGLRQSEALALQWRDIDFESRTVRVERMLQRIGREYRFFEPKTEKAKRSVPLPDSLADRLKAHRAAQIQSRLRAGDAWEGAQWGDLVFPGPNGRPQSGFTITRHLQQLSSTALDRSLGYHDLRRGAISLMAAMGVSPRTAMEIAGHAQISTTMEVYAAVGEDAQREATQRLDAVLFGTPLAASKG